MKVIIAFILLINSIIGFSQETTNLVKNIDGSKSFQLNTKSDTLLISTYPNGRREATRFVKNGQISGLYQRWYENGKLMWEKNLLNNIAEGKAIYYNNKGVKITELRYKNGIISDTIYIKKNIHLVLGKITFTSKVYGGVQRPDGGSNISNSNGVDKNFKMYAALVDSMLKPKLIQYFKSDYNGDFFVIAPKGKISFFPTSYPIKDLQAGTYFPLTNRLNSGESTWNMRAPLNINNESIITITLNQSTVSYAP